MLSNLPRASITPWLHAARLPFLNGLEAQSSKDMSQQNSIAIKKSSSKLRHESKLIQWKSEGVVYLSKLLWWQRETSSDKHIITFCQFGYHKYANEFTWFVTAKKAVNQTGYTLSCDLNFFTSCIILRPLGISFLCFAMLRYWKGKKPFIDKSAAQFCSSLYCKFYCSNKVE